MSTYEIRDPAARAAFERWVSTRRGVGSTYIYQPGIIERAGQQYHVVVSNDDCMADSLEDAEAWLWNNYAQHEVLP